MTGHVKPGMHGIQQARTYGVSRELQRRLSGPLHSTYGPKQLR